MTLEGGRGDSLTGTKTGTTFAIVISEEKEVRVVGGQGCHWVSEGDDVGRTHTCENTYMAYGVRRTKCGLKRINVAVLTCDNSCFLCRVWRDVAKGRGGMEVYLRSSRHRGGKP